MKYEIQSLMVWGAIKGDKTRIIVSCHRKLNSEDYMKIINDNFIPIFEILVKEDITNFKRFILMKLKKIYRNITCS